MRRDRKRSRVWRSAKKKVDKQREQLGAQFGGVIAGCELAMSPPGACQEPARSPLRSPQVPTHGLLLPDPLQLFDRSTRCCRTLWPLFSLEGAAGALFLDVAAIAFRTLFPFSCPFPRAPADSCKYCRYLSAAVAVGA
jgi:hypothetical protein